MGEEMYKSVLIANESAYAVVTLYLYHRWDVLCWMSFESKIIKPKEKHLHRSKAGFQFKLVARFEDDRQQKTVLDLKNWDEDKLFKITGHCGIESLAVVEGKLADYPQEKRLCLRKLQRNKELKSTCGGKNLYHILGLDMDQVRKLSRTNQSKAIKEGFRTQIRIWHPDHNGGDEEMAKEILFAYEILQDEERRTHYHNMAEYDDGWFSLNRYKAIFWPECVSEEQTLAYRKRMALFAASALLTMAGLGLTASSAVLATPAFIVGSAVFGGGFTVAGLQSLQHTLDKNSIVDECRFQDWLTKAGIAFIGGAATGGAAAGITSAVTGIGSAAMESVAVTAWQYMGMGAASGVAGGVAQSLALDAGKKFVDGEDVTWKQMAGHALCGAAIGAAAGVAGGAVTKAVVGSHASAASATLEGEIGEQLFILTGAGRLENTLTRNISKMLAENGTEAVMGSVSQFAEERLDNSVENQSPGKHACNGFKNALGSVAKGLAVECSSAIISHQLNERKVSSKFKKACKTSSMDNESKPSRMQREEQELIDNVRYNLSRENNEHLHNWQRGKCSAKYQLLDKTKPFYSAPSKLPAIFEEEKSEKQDGKVKYISVGAGISAKMIVKYILKENEIIQEVRGSGKIIDIPRNARRIEVRFKVARPHWGDVFKYDRFRRCWCKPSKEYEPHVFKYRIPPIRTFFLSGSLGWVAVMRVSDEYHEETNEL